MLKSIQNTKSTYHNFVHFGIKMLIVYHLIQLNRQVLWIKLILLKTLISRILTILILEDF